MANTDVPERGAQFRAWLRREWGFESVWMQIALCTAGLLIVLEYHRDKNPIADHIEQLFANLWYWIVLFGLRFAIGVAFSLLIKLIYDVGRSLISTHKPDVHCGLKAVSCPHESTDANLGAAEYSPLTVTHEQQ